MRIEKLTENMIRFAESKLDSTEYAGWCLSFIEDALEKSNIIEIFGGDTAKESALLYADAMRKGIPKRGAFVFYDCICLGPDGPVNWGHCGISLGDGRIIHAWDRYGADRRLPGNRSHDGVLRRSSRIHRLGADRKCIIWERNINTRDWTITISQVIHWMILSATRLLQNAGER